MEQVHGTHKASKFEPRDFISGMPDVVITNILDRLPVRDAVRTDALSKTWKYKWTLLTRLVFDKDLFRDLPDRFDGKVISRLLLHLKGPITKFVLYMPKDDYNDEDDEYILDLEDIKHWVMFLSRRGIKEFTLDSTDFELIDLPTQLHSCMELKHLELYYVDMPALPGFKGFPNLLSLHLNDVSFSRYTFGEFTSRCPLLEILSYCDHYGTRDSELMEISKLANLKNLSWSACMDSADMIKSSSFYQLTTHAKLQELNLEFGWGKFMAEAGVDKKVPADFLCLKTLTLSGVRFTCDVTASFVLKMICSSPNLQTLNITGPYRSAVSSSAVCSLDLGCNTMKQLQLRSVSFSSYTGSENEVCLIKLILASSPLLKKIVVCVDRYFVMRHREFDIGWRMAGKLSNLHRASPIVEIDLCLSSLV